MVMVSLVLHLCVAGTVALSYFHFASVPPKRHETPSPIAMVLRKVVTPQVPEKVKVLPVVANAAAPIPSPAQPKIAKVSAGMNAAATKPAPVREVNPNAHVAALPPDSILSPTPPPALNGATGVVFVLDISGSMYEPYNGATRLGFAREAVAQRIRALKDGTPFAIALYAQSAYTSGPLVAASDATRSAALRFIMREVDCGGGTNLPAGLTAAAQLRTGNIVVFSDGDLNMSAFNLLPRVRDILGLKGHCAALTVVGIAPRANVGDDRLLQRLADQQGGAYLEPTLEAGTPSITAVAEAAKTAAMAQ